MPPSLLCTLPRARGGERGASTRQHSPPSVAASKKWVPYFLMRLSVICCGLGRRPSRRMLRMNSGARGSGRLKKSFLSKAKLFTFQRANSLGEESGGGERVRSQPGHAMCMLFPLLSPVSTLGYGIRRGKTSHWDHSSLPITTLEVKDLLRALTSYRRSQD